MLRFVESVLIYPADRRALDLLRHPHPEFIAPGQDLFIGNILHADPLPGNLHLHLRQNLFELACTASPLQP